MRSTKSSEWLARGVARIPAGVNSPVRAFAAVGGQPPFIARAAGCTIIDVDGNSFIDYVGSWGPAIVGHAHPRVVQAVQRAAAEGLSFGAPTALEVQFAETVYARYPSMELMRCVSSGTEATLSALRVARGYTNRDAVVKFEGAYHGHCDAFLVKAGSGAATFGVPNSAGVPANTVSNTLIASFNDEAGLRALFERSGDRIAAVIVEPVAGNMGCVPPAPGFLAAIIDQCRQHGAVSIFDEVMTGCRLASGGAQQLFALAPDLTCLGKVVGGGLPLAVYGGRSSLMQLVAPLGPVYQAGTLSGNPLAVSAGLATLELLDDGAYQQLERAGALLEGAIRAEVARVGLDARVQRVGSMLTVFFTSGPVRSWREAAGADTRRFGRWHRALLEQGVYWPPAQFEAAFLSLAHGDAELEQTAKAMGKAFEACLQPD